MIPDGEKVVSKYLREHEAVTALGARVVAHPPRSDARATPWVMLTQLDAAQAPRDPADRLVEFYFQLDCYAGEENGLPEASALARAVREALGAIADAEHDEAVVSAARITGAARIPDIDFEPARDRFAVTASVWIHAV